MASTSCRRGLHVAGAIGITTATRGTPWPPPWPRQWADPRSAFWRALDDDKRVRGILEGRRGRGGMYAAAAGEVYVQVSQVQLKLPRVLLGMVPHEDIITARAAVRRSPILCLLQGARHRAWSLRSSAWLWSRLVRGSRTPCTRRYLDLDLLYGPNPTDYPRTSANVGA